MFKTNVGTFDRALRVVVGLLLLSLFFIYPDSSWRYASLFGLIPLVTGLVGTCPIYSLLGVSTCGTRRA